MRIAAFYYLDEASPQVQKTISEQLMPAVISYYQAALKVNRLHYPIKLGRVQTQECAGVEAQEHMEKGVKADLILLVTAFWKHPKIDVGGTDALAFARTCFGLDSTERPIIGSISYNLTYQPNTTETSSSYYENMLMTTLHELGHVLGFSEVMFDYFMDPNTGKRLTNTTMMKEINGGMVKILTLEPLTKRLREYFACPTLEGAYLEQEGDVGTKNMHFERRVFMNELMTASSIVGERVSEFTLAFLEGTGWYTPNYEMAEPMTWGKGKGCHFLNTKCIDDEGDIEYPDSFCDEIGKLSCSFDNQAYSICGTKDLLKSGSLKHEYDYTNTGIILSADGLSDNCPYQVPFGMAECKNSRNRPSIAMQGEYFGPESACFTGTLAKNFERVFRPFCFEHVCTQVSENDYAVSVHVGDQTVICHEKKHMSVPGFDGYLECPDPQSFCMRDNMKFCPKGCMGRGSCVRNKCECRDGYYGLDCSYRVANETVAEGSEYAKWQDEEKGSKVEIMMERVVACGVLVAIVFCLCKMLKSNSKNSQGKDYAPTPTQIKNSHEQSGQDGGQATLEMPDVKLVNADWNNQQGEQGGDDDL